MKKCLAIALYFLASPFVFAEPVSKGTLSVTVTSAQNNKGNIEIHLLANKAQFDSDIPAFLICRKAIKNLKTDCNFNDVPYGEYAIFAFHDENLDQNLGVYFFGLPSEKLSISGIDLTRNSSPLFEQSKFSFASQHAQFFLNLQ
jgi:uncharacterized protein (DUF2141 family)